MCRLLLIAFLAGATIYADPITGNGIWQDFPATLASDGYPYIDSQSYDGPRGNIAYFLSGYDGAYPLRSPGVTPQWYGDPSGGPATDFYFTLTHAWLTATLRLENTAWATLNEFGWYDVADPSTRHPIFSGPDAVGAEVVFTPSLQYGYYLVNGLGDIYYTQSSLNSGAEAGRQHFTAFRETSGGSEPDVIWIGVEDVPRIYAGDEINGDYNDMVARVVGLPEPGPLLRAGAVVLALGRARRRKYRLAGTGRR